MTTYVAFSFFLKYGFVSVWGCQNYITGKNTFQEKPNRKYLKSNFTRNLATPRIPQIGCMGWPSLPLPMPLVTCGIVTSSHMWQVTRGIVTFGKSHMAPSHVASHIWHHHMWDKPHMTPSHVGQAHVARRADLFTMKFELSRVGTQSISHFIEWIERWTIYNGVCKFSNQTYDLYSAQVDY